MTFTRSAGFDLSSWTAPSRSYWPEDEGGDENADTTDSSAPANDADDTGSAGDDEGDVLDASERELRHPRIKQLSDEAAKHRLNAKEHQKRADTLKQSNTELTQTVSNLRLENAVLKKASSRITDMDAALKLIDPTGISITAEGDVQGVEEALDALVERYPYVAVGAEDTEGADTDLDAILGGLQSSGRPNNGKRATDNAADITVLRKKFPALARMRK